CDAYQLQLDPDLVLEVLLLARGLQGTFCDYTAFGDTTAPRAYRSPPHLRPAIRSRPAEPSAERAVARGEHERTLGERLRFAQLAQQEEGIGDRGRDRQLSGPVASL